MCQFVFHQIHVLVPWRAISDSSRLTVSGSDLYYMCRPIHDEDDCNIACNVM